MVYKIITNCVYLDRPWSCTCRDRQKTRSKFNPLYYLLGKTHIPNCVYTYENQIVFVNENLCPFQIKHTRPPPPPPQFNSSAKKFV